jgi:Cysteine rich repeat
MIQIKTQRNDTQQKSTVPGFSTVPIPGSSSMNHFRHKIAVVLSGIVISALPPASLSVSAETQVAKDAIAKAEAAVGKVKAACAPDVKSFCSNVTPGEGRLLLCMMAHEDKISDACYDAMLTAAEGVELAVSNLLRTAQACDQDIEKHCASVEAGEGRIAQCLIDKKAELSTQCRGEVAGLEARLKK